MAARPDRSLPISSSAPRIVSLADVLAAADRLHVFAADADGRAWRASGPFLLVEGGIAMAADAAPPPHVAVIASVRGTAPQTTVSIAVAVDVVTTNG